MPGKENDARAETILACFEALYRSAFRLTGNKAQAEDLVQETYLRAWRSLSELHGLSSVQPWMFRILRTVFIDQLRRVQEAEVGDRCQENAGRPGATVPTGSIRCERPAKSR